MRKSKSNAIRGMEIICFSWEAGQVLPQHLFYAFPGLLQKHAGVLAFEGSYDLTHGT